MTKSAGPGAPILVHIEGACMYGSAGTFAALEVILAENSHPAPHSPHPYYILRIQDFTYFRSCMRYKQMRIHVTVSQTCCFPPKLCKCYRVWLLNSPQATSIPVACGEGGGGGGGGNLGVNVSQYFETYPIHIPGLWIYTWSSEMLTSYTALWFLYPFMPVVRQIYQSVHWIPREQAISTNLWAKKYTHLPGFQKKWGLSHTNRIKSGQSFCWKKGG